MTAAFEARVSQAIIDLSGRRKVCGVEFTRRRQLVVDPPQVLLDDKHVVLTPADKGSLERSYGVVTWDADGAPTTHSVAAWQARIDAERAAAEAQAKAAAEKNAAAEAKAKADAEKKAAAEAKAKADAEKKAPAKSAQGAKP